MSVGKLARPEIRQLKSYTAASVPANCARLNANEAASYPYPPVSPGPLNRYPSLQPDALRIAMAELYDVPRDILCPVRGSSEGIDLLVRIFCRAYQDSVVVMPPTFEMYSVYARMQGAKVISVPLIRDAEFSVDWKGLTAKCDSHTRMIFFCSPNNPTGNEVPLQKLLAFAQSVREQSIVIVDEAYVEFSGRSSIAAHIAEHDNLVILRTLSKAYAMAGARCGAIIATAEIVHMVSAMMSPYAFSQPVTALVLNALEPANRQLAQRQIAATVERRDSLVEMLADSAATRQIWPSAGNFVLAGFSEPESWYAALRSRGILIREYGSDPFIPDCVRISVGSAVEIDRLRLALADAQAELS